MLTQTVSLGRFDQGLIKRKPSAGEISMSRHSLLGFAFLLLACPRASSAAGPIFSGPQIGETLPSFKAKGVFGDQAGKEIDVVKQDDGKPVMLIFFHARTRPAFGLMNTMMKYAASKRKDKISTAVVFLTDDYTGTEKWVRTVKKHLAEGVTHVISPAGKEGPGSYGLNRNVSLTILVADKGKVTANFALVQPSLPSDGPKVLKAIVDVTGGGKVPSIADIAGPRYKAKTPRRKQPAKGQNDPKLTGMLRSVINKQASEEDVKQAAKEVEEYVAKNEVARKQLGRISNTVVNSGKLSNYGTEAAQAILRRWAKQYAAPAKKKDRGDKTKQ
jgi:hypothetical protein